MQDDQELRKKAEKRAEEKIGFYVHFSIYLLVNILLYAIWWINNGSDTHPWPIWTTVGWGIGLIAHFTSVFFTGFTKEKMVEKEYQKLKEKT